MEPVDMKRVEIQSTGSDVFVVGRRREDRERGRPDALRAKTWVSLEPGCTVRDVGYPPEEREMQKGHRLRPFHLLVS